MPDQPDTRRGPVAEIITDDMPFVVESLLAGVGRLGGEVRQLIHPIVVVRRSATGELLEILTEADPAAPPPGTLAESWTRFDLAPCATPLPELERELGKVLRDVREIVADTEPMVRRARELADELDDDRGARYGDASAGEVAELLRWLADDHFTFLGYRHYALQDGELHPTSAGLGALRRDTERARAFAPPLQAVSAIRPARPARHHPRDRARAAAPGPPLLPRRAHHRRERGG